MLAEKRTATNVGLGLGLPLQFAGLLLQLQGEAQYVSGLLLALAGLAVFTRGCVRYAQGKGRHAATGLLGLFSVVGLLALLVLPDRHPAA
jgi:uncharacterized membrane protein